MMANDVSEHSAATSTPPASTAASSAITPRSLRQLGLFFAGAGFLTWSTLLTRRAVVRRQIAAFPKFYHPSHRAPTTFERKPEDALIAFEALGLATLNVVSFAVMATGGLSWAFDVSSLDELRMRVRPRIIGGSAGAGVGADITDEEAEKEFAEWMSRTFPFLTKGRSGGSSDAPSDGSPKSNDDSTGGRSPKKD
ncbi:hypothetical protein VTK73DRAFT_4714 [Phialemonium thermophilum]|uniref:Altered inheritance of mitochondria protein 11 n=1 Tax=Phialemonium thermophilum TaxID=223376 RepID=A0ABR3WS77_9PEZI